MQILRSMQHAHASSGDCCTDVQDARQQVAVVRAQIISLAQQLAVARAEAAAASQVLACILIKSHVLLHVAASEAATAQDAREQAGAAAACRAKLAALEAFRKLEQRQHETALQQAAAQHGELVCRLRAESAAALQVCSNSPFMPMQLTAQGHHD